MEETPDNKASVSVPSVPADWPASELTAFLDHGRSNVFATFVRWPREFGLLSELNSCFVAVLQPESSVGQLLPGLFALRAQSAFLAASTCALSGQALDTYLGLRGSLEAALYAVFVEGSPQRQTVWLSRSESSSARAKVRRMFTVRSVLGHLRELSAEEADSVSHLYDLTIELGAHPNVDAFSRNLERRSDELLDYYKLQYLAGGTTAHHDAMLHCIQIGCVVLRMLRHTAQHAALYGRVDARVAALQAKVERDLTGTRSGPA